MSELDNTNELDSYGVWVKNPPKTVDGSSTNQTETSNDLFNIDTDLPDFSDLDVISESTGIDDYDNNDTSLSEEELNAIAGVTADTPLDDFPEETVSEAPAFEEASEEVPAGDGDEEISLDEFLDGGVFETGPDEDKIREHEGDAAPVAEETSTETESVDLADFGFDDSASEEEAPVAEETPSFAESDQDDIFNIDLSFDSDTPAPAAESSGFTSEPVSLEEPAPSADSPAGTEDVDLSEFGFDDLGDDSSSSDSSSDGSSDGMESVDLSEFGFDDTSDDGQPVEENEPPVEGSMAIEEETAEPAEVTEDFTVDSTDTTVSEPSLDDSDFTVTADDDNMTLEADSVSDTTPSADFAPAEDSDFDVNSILGDVTDEDGKTVSIGDQEENIVKEVTDVPSEDFAPAVESEDIEDFNSFAADVPAPDSSIDIPDTFEEEASALFDNEADAGETSQFAETIKAPILEEMEATEEQPSTQMTAIFSQIVGELSSLKDEIASLKNDLSTLKENNAISSVAQSDSSDDGMGFFANTDEDDTIALSNDELDNILNTASFSTEEAVTETAEAPESDDDDEIQPDLELPEETVSDSEINDVAIPDEDFSDSTDFGVDFNNETLEEPSLDSVDYSSVNGDEDSPENEISVPKSDDMIVEASSSDLMGSEEDTMTSDSGIEETASAEDIAAFADFSADEPSIEDSLTADKLDYISADTDKAVASIDLGTPAQDESIPGDLKTEIKSVLSYMDQLLENLPEDKIAEFAQSEQFDTYKKLFKELGLA